MKNLFLLSLAAACVCACAQNASSEAVYEWEGVKLSYDSARYEIRELDEDAMWGMLSLFGDVRFNVD